MTALKRQDNDYQRFKNVLTWNQSLFEELAHQQRAKTCLAEYRKIKKHSVVNHIYRGNSLDFVAYTKKPGHMFQKENSHRLPGTTNTILLLGALYNQQLVRLIHFLAVISLSIKARISSTMTNDLAYGHLIKTIMHYFYFGGTTLIVKVVWDGFSSKTVLPSP